MKKIFIIAIFFSLSWAQADLSSSQLENYYNNKLTVQLIKKNSTLYTVPNSSSSIGIMSHQSRGFWKASQGTNRISEVAFLKIVGWQSQANKRMMEIRNNNKLRRTSGTFTLIGTLMALPITENYTVMWTGALVATIGIIYYVNALTFSDSNSIPYQTAIELSTQYNAKLLKSYSSN